MAQSESEQDLRGRERAARAKAIREALGLDQWAMAERLTAASSALNIGVTYDNTMVSKMEAYPKRKVGVDDVAAYAACDPEGRGLEWMGWGILHERVRVRPAPDNRKKRKD